MPVGKPAYPVSPIQININHILADEPSPSLWLTSSAAGAIREENGRLESRPHKETFNTKTFYGKPHLEFLGIGFEEAENAAG